MPGRDRYDNVCNRTAFYERIKTDGVEILMDLPFYFVTYPGVGSMFEPVDCMKRRQNAEDATNSSIGNFKDVHDRKEYDYHAKINYCKASPDGTDVTLHSFSWDWPRG